MNPGVPIETYGAPKTEKNIYNNPDGGTDDMVRKDYDRDDPESFEKMIRVMKEQVATYIRAGLIPEEFDHNDVAEATGFRFSSTLMEGIPECVK